LQIDNVVEVALLLRVRRRILAAHHANQPDVVGTTAHHLERLHQAREPIAIDAHLFFDLGRRADRTLVDGWRRARFGRRALLRRGLGGRLRRRGFALGFTLGRGFTLGSGFALGSGFTLGGRCLRFGGGFGSRLGRRFGRLRRFRRWFSSGRFGGRLGRACLRGGLRRRLACLGGLAACLLWR